MQLSASYENMETEHMSQHGEHMMSSYLGTPLSVDELSRQPSSVSSDFPGTPSELSSPISQWQPMYISGRNYHHKNNNNTNTNDSQANYDDYHNSDGRNHENNQINNIYSKKTNNNNSINSSKNNDDIKISLKKEDTSINENASVAIATGDSSNIGSIRRSTRTSRNKNPLYTDTPLTKINLAKTTFTIAKKKNNGYKNDINSHNTCTKHGVLYCPQQQQQQQHLGCKHHPSHHQHPHHIHHHHHHNHSHYHSSYHHQHHHHFHHHQHRSALRQKKGTGLRNKRGTIRTVPISPRVT